MMSLCLRQIVKNGCRRSPLSNAIQRMAIHGYCTEHTVINSTSTVIHRRKEIVNPSRNLSISSLSDKIWDIVQSRSLNPTNPLLESISQGYRDLDFSRILPHHIENSVAQCQTKYEEQLESLEKFITKGDSTLTYENVIFELDRISRPLIYLKSIVILLSVVKGDDTLSETLSSANEKIELTHERSSIIFNALTYIEKDVLSSMSSPEERIQVVQALLRKSKLKGTAVDLQNEVERLTSVIEQLESEFFTLSSFTKEEHGKVTSTREIIPYMYKILSLKRQRSQILGYENDAQMSFDEHNSTAKNVDIARAMHEYFAEKALARIQSLEFIADQLNMTSNSSFLHDIRSHFELDHVLHELFELCSSLFGITIVEEQHKDNIMAWDENVRLFHVYDHLSENHIGEWGRESTEIREGKVASFYLDPFRRKHKSSGGFVVPISYKDNTSNGHQAESLVAICLNIPVPIWDDSPVYLDFKDVITIFHEFGHALQLLLADVELGAFCGTLCVEEDSSEIVSQFMEYWLFEGSLVSKLSENVETEKCLPSDVIDKIKRWRFATKSLELSHRLFLGGLELEIHSNFDPSGDDSIVSLQREYAERFCPHQSPPRGNIDPLIEIFQNNAKGKYSAQYRYLWSEIMSADAFEQFSVVSGRLLNPKDDLVKDMGRKFRYDFLEAGNAISTMKAYRNFRGQDATMEPLLRMYGLLS